MNCLSAGNYTGSSGVNLACGYGITITNCYRKTSGGSQGTDASSMTATELATALNNGGQEVWVQDPITNQPMLAIFANAVTLSDGDDLSALSAYAGKTCKVDYSRSFTEAKSSTVCLPFAFAKGSVGTFYTFTGITHEGSNYEATMTEYTGATLEANTPYLFTPSATHASCQYHGRFDHERRLDLLGDLRDHFMDGGSDGHLWLLGTGSGRAGHQSGSVREGGRIRSHQAHAMLSGVHRL